MPPLLIHSKEQWENHVVTSFNDGASIRWLTREFKVSRNTIRRILRSHTAKRNTEVTAVVHQKNRRASKLDKYIPLMKELLEKYPFINGKRMFEELNQQGYSGGITIVRERLSLLVPSPKKKPTMRFETEPI
jgi:transposase